MHGQSEADPSEVCWWVDDTEHMYRILANGLHALRSCVQPEDRRGAKGDRTAPTSEVTDPRVATVITEYESTLGAGFGMLAWGVEQAAKVPERSLYANSVAGAACFARAINDLGASLTLATSHQYGQAIALLRSAYEAASLGRVLAHSPKQAERWIEGDWHSDRRSRQFVRDVMFRDRPQDEREDAVAAYEESYEQLSRWAHPTRESSLLYLTDQTAGGFRAVLEPEFEEHRLRFVLDLLQGELVFCLYAFRNATARVEVLGADWLARLDQLAADVTGGTAAPLDVDWSLVEEKHERLLRNLRHNSDFAKSARREGVDNLLDREGGH